MSTRGPSGRIYGTGFRRGPERPEKWRLELRAPAAVDRTKVRSLAAYVLQPPFDQGNEGSCTANSGCLMAMACATIDGTPVPVLSRSWMYYRERAILATLPNDSGADVIDEFDVDSQDGNIADSAWPYDANPAEAPPADAAGAMRYKNVAAYQPIATGTQTTIDAILAALDNVQPVAIGLYWDDSYTAAYEQGAVVTISMANSMQEGHALTIKGWAPPSSAYPNGVLIAQGSWGTVSPADTAIWADAKAGDHYIDAGLFVASGPLGLIVNTIYAGVPMTAPAVLSLAIQAPSSILAGNAAAFAATVTGAPAGTVVDYAWDFGDGSTGAGATISHVYGAPGTFAVSCVASVATTGATASASVAVSVGANPTPPPLPSDQFWQWLGEDASYCLGQPELIRVQQATVVRSELDGFYPATSSKALAPAPPPIPPSSKGT